MKETKENKGIHLQVINILLLLAAAVITLVLLYATMQTYTAYDKVYDATEDYIVCQQAASDLQMGSDYLTEQVRIFTVTADREAVDNYFREVEVTRRRDRSVETIRSHLAGSEAERYITEALRLSDELKSREFYAMHLTALASGQDPASFPEDVQKAVPDARDLALPPEDMLDTARKMVFDDIYRDYKALIEENVNLCVNALLSETRALQQNSAGRLISVMRSQHIMIALLLITVLVFAFLNIFLVFLPLRSGIRHIQDQKYLPMTGSYELQYLAETYNNMFRSSQQQTERLSYDATHDGLTGLYNRSAFEEIKKADHGGPVALLLIDADYFKNINDTYGHVTGDKVLIKIASILRDSFRAEDYVCRVGGDEFAVIMIHCGSNLEELIRGKAERANAKLADTSDGLPAISISVGVAFSDRLSAGWDLFKDADKALYQAKENGRSCTAFFRP